MKELSETELRHEIMILMKANRIPVDGDTWFRLAFMTKETFTKLHAELTRP